MKRNKRSNKGNLLSDSDQTPERIKKMMPDWYQAQHKPKVASASGERNQKPQSVINQKTQCRDMTIHKEIQPTWLTTSK